MGKSNYPPELRERGLWPALIDGSTRQDLVTRLCETYDVTKDEAAVDVDTFLRTCQERGSSTLLGPPRCNDPGHTDDFLECGTCRTVQQDMA